MLLLAILLLTTSLGLAFAGQLACTAQFFVAQNYGGEVGAISLSPVLASSASTVLPDISALPSSRSQNWGDHIQSLRILCICVGGTGSCQDNFGQVKLYMYADPFWLGTRGGASRELACTPLTGGTYCATGWSTMPPDWSDRISAVALTYGMPSYLPPLWDGPVPSSPRPSPAPSPSPTSSPSPSPSPTPSPTMTASPSPSRRNGDGSKSAVDGAASPPPSPQPPSPSPKSATPKGGSKASKPPSPPKPPKKAAKVVTVDAGH